MEQTILTTIPIKELQVLIIEWVSACLKYHNPAEPTQPQTPEPEQTFNIQELADYLKCTVQTVHNLKKAGLLPFYRFGRNVYFKKSEIDSAARVVSSNEKKIKKK